MTVPYERSLALKNVRAFLRDLLDPKKTPKVPKEVRTRAYWCLRHFPADFELARASNNYHDVFDDEVFKNDDADE